MKSNGMHDYEQSAETITVTGWACRECGRFFGKDEHMARWCCARTVPCDCGGRIDGGWTHCSKCRSEKDAARESARYEEAEKLTEFSGPIFSDGIPSNEGFFETVDELIDYLCTEPDLDIPDYVWTCTCKPMLVQDASDIAESATEDMHESAYDSVRGIETLQAALDDFVAENSKVVSWEPDFSKCLLISEEIKKDILAERSNQTDN